MAPVARRIQDERLRARPIRGERRLRQRNVSEASCGAGCCSCGTTNLRRAG